MKPQRTKSACVPAGGVLLTLGLVTSPGLEGATSPPRPTEFDICQGCHGVYAQGNADLSAPRLAGLAAQYIGRQLADFRDGRRGTRADDRRGAQMVQIASMLDDAAFGRLSAYIGAMPEVPAPATIGGSADAGEATYATCAACHGANGEGDASLGAPRLAGMSDWYLLRQLEAYLSGLRGSAPGDEQGAAMRAVAANLSSAKAMRDVIAYAVARPGQRVTAAQSCKDEEGAACGSSH